MSLDSFWNRFIFPFIYKYVKCETLENLRIIGFPINTILAKYINRYIKENLFNENDLYFFRKIISYIHGDHYPKIFDKYTHIMLYCIVSNKLPIIKWILEEKIGRTTLEERRRNKNCLYNEIMKIIYDYDIKYEILEYLFLEQTVLTDLIDCLKKEYEDYIMFRYVNRNIVKYKSIIDKYDVKVKR